MNINATLLGQTVAFVIFIAICWKYVWPPIIAIMEEREKRIADGLEAAKKADDSLEEAQLAFDQEMNKAKAEAAEILEKANARASQIVNDATSKAETEELKEMLIKIRFIYFEKFIFILFLLTLILKKINVCSVNILTKMFAVSTLLTINVIIV